MVECRAQMIISTTINPGGMAEWTKAVVLKTTVGETSPGVRIPPSPPVQFNRRLSPISDKICPRSSADRAPGCGLGGRRFESCRGHLNIIHTI